MGASASARRRAAPVALLLVSATSACTLDEPSTNLSATIDAEGRLVLDADLHELARPELSDGGQHVTDIRVAVLDDGPLDAVLARQRTHCVVRYSAWTASYVVLRTRDADLEEHPVTPETFGVRTLEEVHELCLHIEPLGPVTPEGWRPGLVVAGHATFDPPTSATIHLLRRWTADPDADGRPGFFGAIAQLFLHRELFRPVALVPLRAPITEGG